MSGLLSGTSMEIRLLGTSGMNGFAEFILKHENDDTDRLLLNREKYPGIDMTLAVNTILSRRKLRGKVPSFYGEPSLIYPRRLSAEQCSSEESARYKAELIRSLFSTEEPGNARMGSRPDIADLTGGLGVDTFAFSGIAGKVLYNEMNPELADAARHNFKVLGAGNITVSNRMVVPEPSDNPMSATPGQLLGSFSPDVIFLDPARRDGEGKKVFLIEDCQPDILTLKEELLGLSRFVVVKLSPMADIDMVLKRLGPQCRLLEVVSVKGECKELIVVLDREHHGECTITANCNGTRFSFTRSEEASAICRYAGKDTMLTLAGNPPKGPCHQGMEPKDGITDKPQTGLQAGQLLLEPDKALMKAAPFKLLCQRFGLVQMDRSTHYFIASATAWESMVSCGTSDSTSESSALDRPSFCIPADMQKDELQGLFKSFRILRAAPLDKRSIKEFAKEFPQAEVTARNIPMTSEVLRRKLGVGSSDEYHIFGLKAASQNWLIACRRV
ncbi:MAG: class I SAM-dependent methyltransferase [Clostridium sp.]|nr:class I SAM-dependent methyltransferase [Bacteroides sp.]MCM1197962.1 class I SAM-dependent methyltransferase [Clostridium sp.]